jgi:putative PIN family toxin of toxin-antitoxin system
MRASECLSNARSKAILHHLRPRTIHYERDPNDEMYINLAIIGNAAYLVSRDKDLLELMTTSADIARQFTSP